MKYKLNFVIAISLALLVCQPLMAKKKKPYFNKTEFSVSFNITHPIMSANFVADAEKELLVFGEDDDGNRKLALYAFNHEANKYQLFIERTIPKNSVAFDFLTDPKGIDKLLLVESEKIFLIDFSSEKTEVSIKLPSIYLNPKPQFLAKKELVKDLNGDGLDDIYISDFSRLSILLQQPGGEFVANDLPIKASVDMSRSEISFSETSIYLGDQNGDQLDDIMLLENGALMVFEQTSDGRFSDLANQLSLPIAISSRPWWSIRGADGEQLDQSSLKHLMLETIEDINGDSIVDLMLRETNSSGVFDRQNIYQIYFGELQENQLKFNQSANTSIRAEGTLSGLDIIDFNKDGKKEILVSSFDIGVSQIIGALLSGSIDQDVYIFALDDEGKFSKEPLFSEEVDLNFSLSSGRSGQAVLLAADFNGDGLNEMMLSASDNKLAIYQGVKDSDLFRSKVKKYKIKLPQNGSMVVASDLNNNGQQQIIIRYGKQDKKELRRKVVILSLNK